MEMCGLCREVRQWQFELRWMYSKAKGKALISVIMRCACAALVYNIWKERNRRLHGRGSSSEEELMAIVSSGLFKVAQLQSSKR